MPSVYSCLSTMKISWLRRLQFNSDSEMTLFLYNLFPEMQLLSSLGSEYAHVVMQKVENPFWKDVMKHYRNFCCKCPPINAKEFLSEFIHYNMNILRDHKVVFVKEWVDAGIVKISHLVDDRGQFLSFEDFVRKYPRITRTNFLMYEGIVRAVRRYLQKFDFMSENVNVYDAENKVWLLIECGNKVVKNTFVETGAIPTAVSHWNGIFTGLQWNKIFLNNFSVTRDTQLRWFQSRLLHRILPTNKYLHTCNIADSPLCTFCQLENETISHLFWHCHHVQTFWAQLLSLIHEKCTNCDRLAFSEKLILFGWNDTTTTDKIM